LKRHNEAREKYTAPYVPWVLIWSTVKSSRSEAIILERKLKNLSPKRLNSFIQKYS
jgi:putative endonuclease